MGMVKDGKRRGGKLAITQHYHTLFLSLWYGVRITSNQTWMNDDTRLSRFSHHPRRMSY